MDPVIAWADHLFLFDPAPIFTAVQRLEAKRGREVMARCSTMKDGHEAGDWLLDRVSRLAPGLQLTTTFEPGGGQFLLVLATV